MATPVTDLHRRLREAGLTDAQADAIASGFEALDRKLDELDRKIDAVEQRLSARIDAVEARLRIHGWLLALILAAVVAPYVERLFTG